MGRLLRFLSNTKKSMRHEPERQIKKLLRAYARKRWHDAGEPPAPSAELRRRFHAEAARWFGSSPAPGQSWLERFVAAHWVKLAVAAGAAAVAIAAFVSVQKPSDSETSETEPVYSKLALPGAGGEGSAHTGGIRMPELGESTFTPLGAAAQQFESFTPALPSPASGLGAEMSVLGRGAAASDRPAVAGATIAARNGETNPLSRGSVGLSPLGLGDAGAGGRAPATDTSGGVAWSKALGEPVPGAAGDRAAVGSAGRVGATNAWAFKSVDPAHRISEAPGRGAPQPVLNTFRIERHGELIRVIDQDGSIYAGVVQASAPLQATGGTGGSSAPEPEVQTAPSEQSFFFNVSGTNRTLGQPVVFVGRVEIVQFVGPPVGGLGSNSLTGSGAGGFPTGGLVETGMLLVPRVTGTAHIGQTQALRIEAVRFFE
ncbi:MAG: hypothetical protein NZ739_07980 [Verrucomicrobiae bacterium]|nr:hypothetical protein [Verrucomicrobiae bacterium]